MGNFLASMFGGNASPASETESGPSLVMKFSSEARWQLHFNSIKDTQQLMVIDFSATWCGPCRMIEPVFEGLSQKFSDVSFVRLDVDELPGVAKQFNVTAMPTFVLVKQGKEVDRIIGAKKDELERKVSQHRST